MLPYSSNQITSDANCNSFVGREVGSIGGSPGDTPWKWLNVTTRATNWSCVAHMPERVCSDFLVFGLTGFLGCKKQKILSHFGSEIEVELVFFWQVTNLILVKFCLKFHLSSTRTPEFCKLGPMKHSFSVDLNFSRKKCKWRRKNSI